ncbi:MAG: phosphatase PAP2 family protein [Nitrosopumilaceae archaeon]
MLLATFIIISYLVHAGFTSQFDEDVSIYFQSVAGSTLLDLSMWFFTEIGGIFTMLIFSVVLFIIKKTRRIGLVLILSVLVGTIVSGYLKAYVIDRDRPDLDYLGTSFPIELEPDTFVLGTTGSFPSGHATRVAVFAFVLGFALSTKFPRGCYLIWIYPFVVSVSRMFVLQHFPTDVIAGTILGVLIATTVSKLLKLNLIFEKLKT